MMTPPVPLTRSDAWLLAALTERRQRTYRTWELIADADHLNRAIPSFDEISFGVPRLVSAGMATIDEQGRLKATRAGRAVRQHVRAGALGEVLSGMAAAVGATPYPEPEVENRSLGRLAGFERADYDAALATYRGWFDRWSVPFRATLAVANRVADVFIAARRFWRSRRKR